VAIVTSGVRVVGRATQMTDTECYGQAN